MVFKLPVDLGPGFTEFLEIYFRMISTIIKAISGARAYDLDQRLFNHYGVDQDQFMELAGLCYGSI